MNAKLQALRKPIVPARVRRIDGGFAFLPHRFLRDGFLSALDRDELALYVFLLLGGNREGVSFYPYDVICSALALTLDDYIAARNGLVRKDLLAFDGTRFQVLSLPPEIAELPAPENQQHRDPASVRAAILAALDHD